MLATTADDTSALIVVNDLLSHTHTGMQAPRGTRMHVLTRAHSCPSTHAHTQTCKRACTHTLHTPHCTTPHYTWCTALHDAHTTPHRTASTARTSNIARTAPHSTTTQCSTAHTLACTTHTYTRDGLLEARAHMHRQGHVHTRMHASTKACRQTHEDSQGVWTSPLMMAKASSATYSHIGYL